MAHFAIFISSSLNILLLILNCLAYAMQRHLITRPILAKKVLFWQGKYITTSADARNILQSSLNPFSTPGGIVLRQRYVFYCKFGSSLSIYRITRTGLIQAGLGEVTLARSDFLVWLDNLRD
jgi:hypothetical protein